MGRIYLRGDLYYADLDDGLGSEQKGRRPVVIIQNDKGNRYSPTVIVAAVAGQAGMKAKLPTHYPVGIENGLERPSIVLLEQLRTIDKGRLESYIGHLDGGQIKGLNRALAVSVGLTQLYLESKK